MALINNRIRNVIDFAYNGISKTLNIAYNAIAQYNYKPSFDNVRTLYRLMRNKAANVQLNALKKIHKKCA